ncbi:beta-hexosaminidase [Coprinopsis cinerea okayama7|uniref:Beta-hexosaminidase n=1 Tax=Coprinopsis cinerea (strain Okayama-7 / 130 / ATCC MYA-4618 / FGSC 9003) TaxID=240176 RepID=A8NQP2_COPC7|nr:beta-hexosaminidase [Coprinopsis cinerea okayama7\|eukprot:XP_001835643.2 beta-hexosaminidase [Coprinopsis cinerea okayama7\
MRSLKYLLCLSTITLAHALWPLPRNLETGTNFVKLSPNFDIKLVSNLESSAPEDLLLALTRTKERIVQDKHQRLTDERGAKDLSNVNEGATLSSLVLSLRNPPDKIQSISVESVKPLEDRNEVYSLNLPSDGSPATITADTTLGLLRGLTTFEQLWYWVDDDRDGVVYTYQAPVVIKDDSPSYPYRGLLLDTSRNFFPVDDILRTLDAMSMVKMSVFHWHVVDSQSFPLEVPGYPELSQKGAYSPSQRYKTEDVQTIVKYASERGIDVLMEIDTPGHTTSVAASHPEHVACAWADPWYNYAHEPPAGQLRITSEKTREFTVSLLSNIAETLPSSMFGTGGDEINLRCYLDDEQTKIELKDAGLSIDKKGLDHVLNDFVDATHKALKELKKTPVVWEEIALSHDLTSLSNETIVTVWTDSSKAADAINKGFRIVHAPSNYFYLDCGGGGWLGNSPTGNSWCDPFKTWQKAYTFDPQDSISPSKAHLVLGGQQLLWAEQSSPENLDSIVWPRAAASAEVFWTGLHGSERNLTDALSRLHDLRYRMVQRKIRAIPLQPHWCALQPEKCLAAPWVKSWSIVQNSITEFTRRLIKIGRYLQGSYTLFGRVIYEF